MAILQVAKRTGAMIEVIPDDADGVLDQAALERMIDKRVRLIAMTWVPTNGGLVNPAAAVGRIARAYDIPSVPLPGAPGRWRVGCAPRCGAAPGSPS